MSRFVNRPARAGFTLVELLVVIAIIGILMSMLLPAVMFTQASMRTSSCKANLHQIGIAMQMYVDRQGQFGIFPDAAILPKLTPDRPSIATVLGPYIEDSRPVFKCPSDIKYADEQGLSYEYPNSRIANKTRQQLVANSRGDVRYSSTEYMLMYDYRTFHGIWNTDDADLDVENNSTWGQGTRNYLYLDGHVDNF